MNPQKFFSTLFIIGLLLLTAVSAQAQTTNTETARVAALAAFKRHALEPQSAAPADENLSVEQPNSQRQRAEQSGLLDILERQKKALAGSWLLKIHAPDGDPLTDFLGLVTFHEDGTLTSSTQIDITTDPPFITSVAHGVWMHQGGRTFDVTFVSLVVDLKGNLIGTAKLSQRITLDESGNNFSSHFNVEITDPDGHTFNLAPGTEDGKRIKVEPVQ